MIYIGGPVEELPIWERLMPRAASPIEVLWQVAFPAVGSRWCPIMTTPRHPDVVDEQFVIDLRTSIVPTSATNVEIASKWYSHLITVCEMPPTAPLPRPPTPHGQGRFSCNKDYADEDTL